eukprot:6195144-Pleurochrysis_carterae.AAC.2
MGSLAWTSDWNAVPAFYLCALATTLARICARACKGAFPALHISAHRCGALKTAHKPSASTGAQSHTFLTISLLVSLAACGFEGREVS